MPSSEKTSSCRKFTEPDLQDKKNVLSFRSLPVIIPNYSLENAVEVSNGPVESATIGRQIFSVASFVRERVPGFLRMSYPDLLMPQRVYRIRQ